jgi:hypothetical protein
VEPKYYTMPPLLRYLTNSIILKMYEFRNLKMVRVPVPVPTGTVVNISSYRYFQYFEKESKNFI